MAVWLCGCVCARCTVRSSPAVPGLPSATFAPLPLMFPLSRISCRPKPGGSQIAPSFTGMVMAAHRPSCCAVAVVRNPKPQPEWPFAIQMGSIMNHATAQMNHELAHQAAFQQHSIGAPPSNPLLNRCPEFTRERCEGSKKPRRPQHPAPAQVLSPPKTHSATGDFALATVVAEVSLLPANIRIAAGRKPVALAVGFLDPPPPASTRNQVRAEHTTALLTPRSLCAIVRISVLVKQGPQEST